MALLVVACLNVAILLVASSVSREGEFAIRAALGADRVRILRQLLTESLVLSLAGGLLGLIIAHLGLSALTGLMPQGLLPLEVRVAINTPVLTVTVLIAVLTTVFFGVAPASHLLRSDANGALRGNTPNVAGIGSHKIKHKLLVVAQIAFGLVVLAAAVASTLTFVSLYKTRLGYDPKNVLILSTSLSEGTYAKWGERVGYYDQIRRSLEKIPGVKSVAVTVPQGFPPVSREPLGGFQIIGKSMDAGQNTVLQWVSPEYFQVLRIPLLRGAIWTESDNQRAARVAVINREMAQRFWPNADPIGQQVRLADLRPFSSWIIPSPNNTGVVRIIGVVGNAQNNGLHQAILPAIYVPYTSMATDGVNFVLRTTVPPLTIVRAARACIRDINANQPVSDVSTAEEQLVQRGWLRERFTAAVLFLFAAISLVLFLVGLYSVVSYEVSRRSREFSIRMALGASPADVVWIVLGSLVGVLAIGIALGIGANIALSKIADQWTQLTTASPTVLVVVCTTLVVTSALASVVPAYRAAHAEPMQVLRGE